MRGLTLATAAVLAAALLLPGVSHGAASVPVKVDGGVLFSYDAPDAKTVSLAGEFNGWSTTANPMSDDDGDGVWKTVIELQSGRSYEYKYVIDGGVVWHEDPLNPNKVDDEHGGYNSVISIAEDGSVVLGYLEGGAGGGKVYEPVVDELPLLGTKLYLAIVWHQHQPKYLRDLKTGEYAEPWVRLHSIKDYYDMVSILDGYPKIKFTVNLTPVLLTQIQDIIDGYDNGTGTDAYLRMTLKDASALTLDDKIFLLTHFFNANWANKIDIWPRYKALKDMKGGDTRAELEAAAAKFTVQDWRDLQMWFNLAWFDPDFQEGHVTLPDGSVVTVKHLIQKGKDFTEIEKAEMVKTQIAIMRNVVAVHKEARDRGQIEVITTPFYHPILPLIYDTDLARVAMPGTALPKHRFNHPDDALSQVQLAADYYKELFGGSPEGLWPAEGAVAQEIVGTVAEGGFRWMASDDQVLQKSLGAPYLSGKQKYQMYWTEAQSQGEGGGARVAMIFRDHRLSDDIGFNFGKMDGVDAANSMMRSLYSIHKQLANDDAAYVVPIILDGENAWEWYKHDGKEFFHSWYDQLSKAEFVETTTVADFMKGHPPTETIGHLWAGSWINNDFSTWIGEPEENKAWDYLAMVRDDLGRVVASGEADADALTSAFDEMYAAEGSDWFWWYGRDQDSANDAGFDEMYRETLKDVYVILGEEPPAFLSESILTSASGGGGGAMAKATTEGEAELLKGPVLTPEGVLFSHANATAKTVSLAGEFNGWSTTADPMSDPDGDGVWTVTLDLKPGRYEYKFVIDGGAVWEPDEGNPERVDDNHGGENSVLVVK
jgi:alpha-amylase/alpha-mannosidase (GH57 family)